MSVSISIAADDVFTALRTFIQSVIASAPEVVQGLVNRVSTPPDPFIVMTGLYITRIATNIDTYDTDPNTSAFEYLQQNLAFHVQVDCYGPASQEWANILSTLLRDDFGVRGLAPDVVPLYADDPRQMALVNAESQYEQRWMVEAVLQYNPVVTVPMQFANALSIALVDVPVNYP